MSISQNAPAQRGSSDRKGDSGGQLRSEGRESKLGYEATRLFAAVALPLIAKLRTEGVQNVPASGPAILAPNHLSWADIPLLSFPIKRVTHYMAKSELFRIPVLGRYIRILGAFPVRRGESDRDALRIAERLLGEGKLVVIFPEGHRSEEHALIEAHQGVALIAMRANVPVIPIAISGTERAFHDFNYAWRAPRVLVRYGEPYMLESSGGRRTSADLKRHTDEIMRRIAVMLPPRNRGIYAHLVEGGAATDSSAVSPTAAATQPSGTDEAQEVDETPAQPS
jgi:1-acyl-sn-glycerol-3-phosphate acyltransferase